MKRSGPIKRRTPLAAQSAKTRARTGERRSVVRAAYERDGGCVAARHVRDVSCGGPLDGHEVIPRGRGGSAYDINNVVTVCRVHHGWIHDNPREATRHGLLA